MCFHNYEISHMPTVIGTKIRHIGDAYTQQHNTTHTGINTYTYRFDKYLKNGSKE